MTDTGMLHTAGAADAPTPWPVRGKVIYGAAVVAILMASVGLWGTFARLDSAVVANGEFRAIQNRQSVQHFEGGTASQILVANGDVVTQGQTLILLDDRTARAQHALLVARRDQLLAEIARLQTEAGNEATIRFPDDLTARADDLAETAIAIEGQTALFLARRENLDRQIARLDTQFAGARAAHQGIRAEILARRKHLKIVSDQAALQQDLLDDGLSTQAAIYSVAVQKAQLEADITRLERDEKAQEQLQDQIGAERATLLSQTKETVQADLGEAREELDSVTKNLAETESLLDKHMITAPVSGIVTGLTVHTVGGVVPPGQQIAVITPQEGRLVIEAVISPSDADQISAGQDTVVRLSSLKRDKSPEIKGRVRNLSADSIALADGQRAFVAEIEIPQAEAARYPIKPGMPAEVFIRTGERTLWGYLSKPVTDHLARALNEE